MTDEIILALNAAAVHHW